MSHSPEGRQKGRPMSKLLNSVSNTPFFVLFDKENGSGSGGSSEGGEGGEGGDKSGKNNLVDLSQLNEDHPAVQDIVKGLKTKRDELLKTNKQLAEERKKFEGIDPEEARELKKNQQKQQDQELLDEGKVEELLDQRTKRMREDYESQINSKAERIAALEKDYTQLNEQLNQAVLDSQVASACSGAKVIDKAQDYVRRLARDTFQIEDGKPKAFHSNGSPIMGKDTNPITVEEWVDSLRDEHPFIFAGSSGGEAGGSSSAKGGTQKRSQMSVQEKAEYVREHGQAAFNQLPH